MALIPALLLVVAAIVTGQQVEVTPREAVRRAGEDVTMLCKVPYPIDSCRVVVGSVSYILKPDNSEGDINYAGNGLQAGECGVKIRNIVESWQGNITCILPPLSGNRELNGVMRLLVARAPGEPILYSSPQHSYMEGDRISAQCVVPNGRPAAKITWFLDDEPLLSNLHEPNITVDPASDLETISQNITRVVSADDAGRRLRCRAEHAALDTPRDTAKQLIVYYPPKRLESGQITIFGLKLGSEGLLNVTVRSNPPPVAEWTVGDQRLGESQQSNDGGITALRPVHLGGGYYNISLMLHRITKEDVDRTYYLRVSNEYGNEEFAVRLSTMDEPAGVELDTGAIVGIVIGVMILLCAVFLAVFAKATDRWCFSGRGREPKNSGESSDTESAVGGRERSRLAGLSGLGARVRAVLPRAKDKVQATEQQEGDDKPLSEEKKGVVYAELALGDQTTADKPPPPSTEYAEIVYSDQPPPKETKE